MINSQQVQEIKDALTSLVDFIAPAKTLSLRLKLLPGNWEILTHNPDIYKNDKTMRVFIINIKSTSTVDEISSQVDLVLSSVLASYPVGV